MRAVVISMTKGTISIPGYRPEPMFIVRLQTGAFLHLAARDEGQDGTTTNRAHATRFTVRDGEWNANGWARRVLGTVEVF